jgi:hypothetical protein
MPRKKGTALNKVNRNMPEDERVYRAAYGPLWDDPEFNHLGVIVSFIVENLDRESGSINIGPTATLHGKRYAAEQLISEAFTRTANALLKGNARYFERLARAANEICSQWVWDQKEKTFHRVMNDPVYFDIWNACRSIQPTVDGIVRPGDVVKALIGIHPEKVIRDRIKRYGIPGINTRPGRSKGPPKKPRHKEPDLATTKALVKAAVPKRILPNKR